MSWQWLPSVGPWGPVLAAGLTAGLGGWFGGRQSRRNQERQHRFELDRAITEQGREAAREAIAALRYLQRNRRRVVEWSSAAPEGELQGDHEQFDQLGQTIEYLNDEAVRKQVELIHDVIADAWLITRFGNHNVTDKSDVIIWRVCQEGRAILGRYLRGEPTEPPSNYLESLRHAHDSAHDDMARQHEEQEELQRAIGKGDLPAGN
jgi:hypothetical protein